MDAAENDQILSTCRGEGEKTQVDAVVDGCAVVQLRCPIGIRDRYVRRIGRLIGRKDLADQRSRELSSAGAVRQYFENANGSQSRWLCTRSNSDERASAWATCKPSQTRPSRLSSSA